MCQCFQGDLSRQGFEDLSFGAQPLCSRHLASIAYFDDFFFLDFFFFFAKLGSLWGCVF